MARVKNHPTVRAMGFYWWDGFVDEAQKVSAIDDLPKEYREVIKPLVVD